MINTLNNSRKYVIKCPFDVTTKDSVSHAPSSSLVAHLYIKMGRQIPQMFPLHFKMTCNCLSHIQSLGNTSFSHFVHSIWLLDDVQVEYDTDYLHEDHSPEVFDLDHDSDSHVNPVMFPESQESGISVDFIVLLKEILMRWRWYKDKPCWTLIMIYKYHHEEMMRLLYLGKIWGCGI